MSLTCKQVAEELLRFRDGELDPTQVAWLRDHLRLCPPCLTLLGSYGEVVRVLEALRPVDMPEGTLERIRGRLEGRA